VIKKQIILLISLFFSIIHLQSQNEEILEVFIDSWQAEVSLTDRLADYVR